MKAATLGIVLLLASVALARNMESSHEKLSWLSWSDDLFVQAKCEHRFELLDLETVWCHWCHVMDATTYKDRRVIALLNSGHLTVKGDQDFRPDLCNRYEDYGWPATVVFDGEGSEIVKRRGCRDPEEMPSMLQAIIDDPSPAPSVKLGLVDPRICGAAPGTGSSKRTIPQTGMKWPNPLENRFKNLSAPLTQPIPAILAAPPLPSFPKPVFHLRSSPACARRD